jgi:N-acetylmuramoyl-L-alanine amidase
MMKHTPQLARRLGHGPFALRILPVIIALLLALPMSAVAAPPDIFVAYPAEVSPGVLKSVAFDHVLLEGHVPPGASLQVSGREVEVGLDGLFIEWLPLQPGENILVLRAVRQQERFERTLRITSQVARALPATPTAIVESSISPRENIKVYDESAGASLRTLTVSFEGSPGGEASFKVGERGPFPMPELQAGDFPGERLWRPGRYEGALVLRAGDAFENAPISISLRGVDGQVVTATARGKITVSEAGGPRVGIVTGETVGNGVNLTQTSARNGVARNSVLWLKPGMKFLVVGEEGETFRVSIAPNRSANILRAQMRLLPPGSALPRRYFSRIESRRVAGATQVRFSLPDRVPYSIEQSAAPGDQHLLLRLYNTESDVTLIAGTFEIAHGKSILVLVAHRSQTGP